MSVLEIVLAKPRGFCAGVDRAVTIVEKAIAKYGAPVYVRHEIVHNKSVVERLKDRGAIFVEEVAEVPPGSVVIFSAHGIPKAVYAEAEDRELTAVDATCPLVKKVHNAVTRWDGKRAEVVLIGHPGHPEVIGTMGQLPAGKVKLVSSVEDVEKLTVDDPENLAYTTQTTLSVFETQEIMDALRARFPAIQGAKKGDLCYATTNRQTAVLEIARQVDLLLVIGSQNSSNSNRLRELGAAQGIPGFLIDGPQDLDASWFEGKTKVGITSGASAPEDLVQAVVRWIQERHPGAAARDAVILEEDVKFPLPAGLT